MKKLNELFEVTYGNKLDLNKMDLLPISNGGVNFVGRSGQNHGVSASIAPLKNIQPYEAGLITVALGGTKLLSSFIQEHCFYTAQNVAVLRPKFKMTFAEKLYTCLCIRHNRFRYSAFGREANRTLKELLIPEMIEYPDWINPSLAGIKMPLLTKLENYKNLLPTESGPKSLSNDKVRIDEIFEVHYGSNLELNTLTLDSNGINFVSRTAKNNGVSARIKPVAGLDPIEAGVLTVAGGGSVLETFLQSDPFYSGRDLYYLKPRIELSTQQKLYYCMAIRANKYRYSYGRQANRTLKELLIPAPESIPPWAYKAVGKTISEFHEIIQKS